MMFSWPHALYLEFASCTNRFLDLPSGHAMSRGFLLRPKPERIATTILARVHWLELNGRELTLLTTYATHLNTRGFIVSKGTMPARPRRQLKGCAGGRAPARSRRCKRREGLGFTVQDRTRLLYQAEYEAWMEAAVMFQGLTACPVAGLGSVVRVWGVGR